MGFEYNCGHGRPSIEETQLPVIALRAAFDYETISVERPNGFPYYQWLQSSKGSGILQIQDNVYEIKENSGFIMPPDIPHKYDVKGEEWKLDWLVFDGLCLEDILTSYKINEFKIYNNIDLYKNKASIMEIVKIYHSRKNQFINDASLHTYSVLNQIYVDAKYKKRESKFDKILNYINNNYHNFMSLKNLAEEIDVTTNHLCRLFKKEINQRPFEYIIKVRIHNAKFLLIENKEEKISEIARKCGFENDNYFREVFKRETGVSPSEYRQKF